MVRILFYTHIFTTIYIVTLHFLEFWLAPMSVFIRTQHALKFRAMILSIVLTTACIDFFGFSQISMLSNLYYSAMRLYSSWKPIKVICWKKIQSTLLGRLGIISFFKVYFKKMTRRYCTFIYIVLTTLQSKLFQLGFAMCIESCLFFHVLRDKLYSFSSSFV